MTVRLCTPEDEVVVCRLWRKLMEHHIASDQRIRLSSNAEAIYLDYLASVRGDLDQRILVAEEDGSIVGYALGIIRENPPTLMPPQYGQIGEVFVEPDSRRRGHARTLVNQLLLWFRRRALTVAQLNLASANQLGRKFWKKQGFSDFLSVMWLDL